MELNDRLILLIQQNKVLYDVRDGKYSDSQYKEQVWKDIAQKMGISPESCKKRWKNIRDCYRKFWRESLRKKSSKRLKYYKHASQLDFLLPYFKHKGDFPPLSPQQEDFSKSEECNNIAAEIFDPLMLNQNESERQEPQIVYPEVTSSRSHGDENNALKTFCDSLYYSIQKLPMTLQIETKMKIFQIMTEAELKAHSEHCRNALPFVHHEINEVKQIPSSPELYSSRTSSPS